jgi:hypothetical protein
MVLNKVKPRPVIFLLKTTASVAQFRRRHGVTNSCGTRSGRRAVALAVAAALIHIAVPGGAVADRHCSPVLFRYYDARAALQQTEAACPARLTRALDYMREAAAEAGACGCLDLETEIESFVADLTAAEENCAAAAQKILGLDKRLENRAAGCN